MIKGPTPAQILKHYQDVSPENLTEEVERLASLGTKDALRLLAYMIHHTAVATDRISRGEEPGHVNLAEVVKSN